MDKKDIYEHLANIYLDASLKKKKKSKKDNKFRNLLISNFVVLVLVFSSFFFFGVYKKSKLKGTSQVALVLYPDVAKINFNFDPARKEIYSLKLKNLDLARYKALAFSIKKSNYKNNVSIRVEFNNSYNEKAFIYVKNIPSKWNEYVINFSEFKGISDWSDMSGLLFSVEEWNTVEKQDVVFLENIRVIR